jgi:phosphinothricin acetyltransferase
LWIEDLFVRPEQRGSTFETEPRSAEDFMERIAADRFPFLVSEADGQIIGWAGLAPYSDRPCYAGIGECSIYVTAESRGRGVGTVQLDGEWRDVLVVERLLDGAASRS